MGLEIFERGALPRWAPVRQFLDATEIGDVRAAIADEFRRPGVGDRLRPGQRVAVTAGSRGIDRIDEVVRAVIDEVRLLGAEPFIVPAMGSHGGATAAGQLELVAHYGITEETMGCPLLSSMDTVHLGEVEGHIPVWFDRNAFEADAVIPVGRVKPHTDFRGPVESGLMKMIAIGLGKQKGAEFFHSQGMNEFHHLIPAVAKFTLTQVNIPFGVAVIENGYGNLAQAEAVPAARVWEREQELLEDRPRAHGSPARRADRRADRRSHRQRHLWRWRGPECDQPRCRGRGRPTEDPVKPRIQRVIFRDLTDDTEGNATGIGMADVVLRRAVDKMDPVATYMNMITAKSPQGARIPLTVDTDREAIYVALACCLKTEQETAHIARIQDTKHLETFWASEHLLPELLASGRVEVAGDLRPIAFDRDGMLAG